MTLSKNSPIRNKFNKWRLAYQKEEQTTFDRVVIEHLFDAYIAGHNEGGKEELRRMCRELDESRRQTKPMEETSHE